MYARPLANLVSRLAPQWHCARRPPAVVVGSRAEKVGWDGGMNRPWGHSRAWGWSCGWSANRTGLAAQSRMTDSSTSMTSNGSRLLLKAPRRIRMALNGPKATISHAELTRRPVTEGERHHIDGCGTAATCLLLWRCGAGPADLRRYFQTVGRWRLAQNVVGHGQVLGGLDAVGALSWGGK